MTPSHNAEERLFRFVATGSSTLVSTVVAAIGVSLLLRAAPALAQDRANFLTSSVWDLSNPDKLAFGMAELALVTILVSAFALALAVPVALGVALFVSQYAPRAVAVPVARVVDLLAAVPSIVYGLWGWLFLAPSLSGISQWLAGHLGWAFFFHHDAGAPPNLQTGRNLFTTGVVLAVMILPVITAISREVFAQTPHEQQEAALALGATKWEVIRMTVLPFGRNGFIAGAMLGLGRALGETMSVYLILATVATKFNWSVFDGGATIASKIALGAGELDVNHGVVAGAYHAIAGTLILGAICALVAVPLGVLTAVYLVEYGTNSRLVAVTTFLVDILAGVPSIVATLFVFVLWVLVIGLPTSAFAAAAALVLLMMPLVVRSTEEMLRIVPDHLREASYALGITKARTILRVVLPIARPGIATGVMRALARALGESAPLLVLLPYCSAINVNPFDGNMVSLPSFMLDQQLISAQAGLDRLWGAALTLIIVIAALNAAAALAGKRSGRQKPARQKGK